MKEKEKPIRAGGKAGISLDVGGYKSARGTKIKILCVILATILVFAFTACDGNNSNKVTVTFNYNYDGAPAAYKQEIKKTELAVPPTDPKRDNFKFTGWFTDAACALGDEVDFDYQIIKDVTYYAGWVQTEYVITFDPNFTGAVKTTQPVAVGSKLTQPANPSRTDYIFIAWYSDAACTTLYNFDIAPAQSLTLYAGWEDASTSSTHNVVFSNNYTDGGNYYSTEVINGRIVLKPANPVRGGFMFVNWYTDAACTALYNFNNFVTQDMTLYALWFKTWIFEAEFTYLEDMYGAGFSAEIIGTEVIDRDVLNTGASNGYYVTYLYRKGNTLEFNITSEEEVSNAIMVLRLSAEVKNNMVISSSKWLVQVNDVNLSYPDMVFTNVPEANTGAMRPFDNWTITTSLRLKKGNNVIKLITNNEDPLGGTMYSTAPMVDCMYINTNTALSWTIHYPDNTKNIID